MTEAKIMRDIQVALSEYGCRLFRNNTGLFDTLDGRKIRTGLCVGSSDLIGWTKDGRFLAIEVKTNHGRPTQQQIDFIQAVNWSGGLGFIARSVEEAISYITKT